MKKQFRLVKNEQFTLVVKKGQTLKDKSFTIHYLANDCNYTRVGVSVSTKLGHAVTRNRIKRQIRAMLDERIDYLNSSIDVVVIARNGFLENTFKDNYSILDNLLSNIKGL